MTLLEAVNEVLGRLREDRVDNVRDDPYAESIAQFINTACQVIGDQYTWEGLRRFFTYRTGNNELEPDQGFLLRRILYPASDPRNAFAPAYRIDDQVITMESVPTSSIIHGVFHVGYIDENFQFVFEPGGELMPVSFDAIQLANAEMVGVGKPETYFTTGEQKDVIVKDAQGNPTGEVDRVANITTAYFQPRPEDNINYLILFYISIPHPVLRLDEDMTDEEINVQNIYLPSAPIIHYSVALATRERGESGGTSADEYFQIAEKHIRDAIERETNVRNQELDYYSV